MKICVFANNFSHKIIYKSLSKLKINSVKISKIFTAKKFSYENKKYCY